MKKKIKKLFLLISLTAIMGFIIVYFEDITFLTKEFHKKYLTKGSPFMEIFMPYKAYIYSGGEDEASPNEIGEFIGTSTYNIDHHITTKWQEKGYSHTTAYNVYKLSGHDDLLTLIVETHKGKYVKLYSNGRVNPDDAGNFSYVIDLYNINQETVSSITAKSLNNVTIESVQLSKDETASLLNILLKQHDYISSYYTNDAEISLDITLKTGDSFSIHLVLNERSVLIHDESEYFLSIDDSNRLKDILPNVLFNPNPE